MQTGAAWQNVLVSAATLTATLVAAVAAYLFLFSALGRLARKMPRPGLRLLVERLRRPCRLLLPLLALALVLPSLEMPERFQAILQHLLSLCIIGGIAWLLINITFAGRDHLLVRYSEATTDPFRVRAIQTQLTVAVQIVVMVVLVVALATMLMTFARIRTIGMSILASAGIIGITVGFAAQRSIATLLAGLQIAITQPIRLQDGVLVEGEFGTIEEITLTYVVVKLWDMRRLVVPVTYFLEKPFQNWTRRSTNLLGTVFIYADYTLPVEPVRQKLQEIVRQSPKWDREVCALHVTNVTDRTLELRALMSAADSGSAFDLRCEVREKLLAFLQQSYPHCLPRTRAELRGSVASNAEDASSEAAPQRRGPTEL
jgi:small-conductance mechanosensitive channel